MSLWWNKPPVRYVVAVLSVAIALLITLRLGSPPTTPTPLFILAVMLSAWHGGLRPGLLATALSILAIAYYFEPPIGSFAVEIKYIPSFLALTLSALFVAALTAAQKSAAQSLKRARDELDGKIQELERTNEALQTEIAERRQAEAKLQQQERQHRLTIDTIPALVWRTQPDGSADFFNQPCLDYTGLSVDQALGFGWIRAVHPDDVAGLMDKWNAIRVSEARGDAEARLRRFDGEYRWFMVRAAPLRDGAGRVVKWYGSNTDIEDGKRAVEALRESEEQWKEVFEHNPAMYFMIDTIGTVLSVNAFGAAQLGYTVDELVGQSILSVFFEEDREFVRRNLTVCLENLGRSNSWEVRKIRKDRTILWVRENAKALWRTENHLIVLIACDDITERRRTEDALQQARSELAHVARVTTLGELTASIAHEINQPVGAVVTNADACLQWLGAEPPDLEEARQALGRIIKEGNRAGEVIGRIRALFKKSPTLKDRLDINDTIREVVALTHGEVREHGISLEIRLSSDLPDILGDRIQLHQVILNLIINAIEAMSGDSEGPGKLQVVSERNGAEGVIVAVRDWGTGLGTERLDHLFDAFYSTKPDGMGMGLAISRSIVEAHGGRLWATHNVPRGAIFQFTLPAIGDLDLAQPTTPSASR